MANHCVEKKDKRHETPTESVLKGCEMYLSQILSFQMVDHKEINVEILQVCLRATPLFKTMAQWAIQGTQVQTITKDMFVQETTKVMFGQPFHLQLPHDQLLHLLLDQHDHLGQQDHLEQHNDPALHQRLLPCHALLPHYQHDHLERLNDHALQQRLLLCHAIEQRHRLQILVTQV